jgi:uncharacterized protein (DUF2141 family)
MKLNIFLLMIMSLFFFPSGEKTNLVVKVSDIKSMQGNLYVGLFRNENEFMKFDSAYMGKMVVVKNPEETITFDNVPEGQYAVAVFQDMNLNGKLDYNDLGIPREGFGFSNNRKGPPKFDKSTFNFPGNDTININLITSIFQEE